MNLENQIWIYVSSELSEHRMIAADLEQEGFWDRYADENLSIGKTGSELFHFYERRMKMSLHRSSIDMDSMMYLYKKLQFTISEELKLLLEDRFGVQLSLSNKGILIGFKASENNSGKTIEIDERCPSTLDQVRENSKRVTKNYDEPCKNRVQYNSTKVSTWQPRSQSSFVQDCSQWPSDESSVNYHWRENRKRATTKRRKSFTEKEDLVLWNYVLEQYKSNQRVHPRGIAMWKAYVRNKNTVRSPANLASHFRKKMIPELLYADLTLKQKMKLYKKVNIFIDQKQKLRIEDHLGVNLQLKDGFLQEYSERVEEQSIKVEDKTPEEQYPASMVSVNDEAQPQDVEVQETSPENREITTQEVVVEKIFSKVSDADPALEDTEEIEIEDSSDGYSFSCLSPSEEICSGDLDDLGTKKIAGELCKENISRKRKMISSVNECEVNPTTSGINSGIKKNAFMEILVKNEDE